MNDRVFGSGDLRFEHVSGWEHVPDGWHQFDVPAVCTDAAGNVYAFWRGDHRVVVYDRGGQCVATWSHAPFDVRAHGIYMSPAQELYLVDEGTHSVGRFTPDGTFLTQFGPSGVPSDSGYDGENYRTVAFGAPPYRRPTGAAVAPSGDVYVSDGYGNARVHRFTAHGTLIQSWGGPGNELEQFHVPHAVWVHADGRVFVADRENERIQIFTPDGRLQSHWTDVQRPQGIYIDAAGLVYIAEGSWPAGWESQRRGPIATAEPGRISIYDTDGNVLARWTRPDPADPGHLLSPHGIWVDDEGSIFTCANVGTMGEHLGTGPAPALLKFARL
ncbi:MAG TPA: hypothetical protein VH478_08405 [Trebonia sp.]|nr:hypothetical protein [Trebonia sp.]